MKSNGRPTVPKSYSKNILREIKGSLGRFLAILAITALGVGLFCGLLATKDSMVNTADIYLDSVNMYDLRAISTVGWDDENTANIAKENDVETVYGCNSLDFLCSETGNTVIHSFSLSDDTDMVTIVAGRMPESPNECLADDFYFNESSLYTEISLSGDNESDTFDELCYDRFTIVGLCKSPFYMSFDRGTSSIGSGSVAGYIGLLPEAYTSDYYSEIHITLKNCGGQIYSEEYKDSIESAKDKFTAVFEDQAEQRYKRIKEEAEIRISDARKELSDAEAEISDAEAELEDARKQYDDARDDTNKKLSDGAKQLDDAAKLLEDSKKQIDANAASLTEAKEQLTSAISKAEKILGPYGIGFDDLSKAMALFDQMYSSGSIDESVYQRIYETIGPLSDIADYLEKTEPGLADEIKKSLQEYGIDPDDLTETISLLDQAYTDGYISEFVYQKVHETIDPIINLPSQLDQVEAGLAACANGYYSYNYGVEQYQKSVEEYYKGKKEAQQKLDDALKEIEDGESQLDDAKADLEEGRKKLEDAQAELDDLEEPDVFVLDRTSTVCYSTFESDSDIVQGISKVFPLFFFAIAALVCSTTMNRMVVEQRTQIGTFKALGYRTSAIIGKYLVYSGAAGVTGWAAGFFGGSVLFPKVIWKGYSIMYFFSRDIIVKRDIRLGMISLAVSVLCAMGTTYFTCRSILREVPAQLLRPAAPAGGGRLLLERVGFIWNRIGFLFKVSLRNIVRYKKRLFMMILGIGGCTALLVTGFGINDSIQNIVDSQYDEISLYDISVTFRKDMNDPEKEKFIAQSGLPENSVFFVHQAATDLSVNGRTQNAYFTLCDRSPDGFIDLHDEKGQPVPYPGTGEALICVNLSDMLGLDIGDTFTYTDGDNRRLELRVSGICENFVYNYFYADSSTCMDQWGQIPAQRTALVRIDGTADHNETGAVCSGCDNVSSVSVNQNMRNTVGKMLQALDYIVVLIIFCAAALVFVVLYNLTNINITERIREIATIKVLGFHSGETAAYVFRENIILALLGALAGLPMGRLLHRFVLDQVKINMMHFPVRVTNQSLLWSFLLTVLFTLCVDGVLLFKLKKIDMAGSLKSVE